MEISNATYIRSDITNIIYKLNSVREVSTSGELCLLYSFEAIAFRDYINPDENDIQGWTDGFTDNLNDVDVLTYPMSETLTEALSGSYEELYVIKECPKIHHLDLK